MSNFEKLVFKMRAAQTDYQFNPSGLKLRLVEALEEQVDNYLTFVRDCPDDYSPKQIKQWCKQQFA